MLRRINAVDEYQPGRGFGYGPLLDVRGLRAAPRLCAGWNDSLVSGDMSVKRQSSSRVVGTVSAPTRSTAFARS